jgi:hypothetical protein
MKFTRDAFPAEDCALEIPLIPRRGVLAGEVNPSLGSSRELAAVLKRAGGKLREHPRDELVVAAGDVEPFVVAGEQLEVRAGAVGGQFDQIERGLFAGVAAVLGDGAGEQQLAQAAARPDLCALQPGWRRADGQPDGWSR